MGDYQGGGPYVASRCLDKDSYDDKCYMAYRRVCNK